MSDTNERSVASDGSVAGEPVGWAVVNKNGDAVRFSQSFLTLATTATQHDEIVPLFRQPTLTDAEREVLERLAERLNDWNMDDAEDVVRGILGRLK